MAISSNHRWSVSERLFLSLYGGIAIPILYLVAVIVIFGILGSRLGDNARLWLLFPLVWPSSVIELFYHPRIEAVGDVSAAAGFEFMATIFINFLSYALVTYVSLSILNKLNRLPTV